MCGRFTNQFTWRELVDLYQITEPWIGPASNLKPSFNVAPMQMIVAARVEDGARRPFQAQWGLQSFIPPKGERWKLSTFNATIEKLRGGKRSVFSHAWASEQRCIIPADGWYEWPEPKKPLFFRRQQRATFAFGGLWESVKREDGSDLVSCTFVTTPPNEFVGAVHDRAPVILRPEEFDVWLSGTHAEADALCEPYAHTDLESWPVGPAVGNWRNDGPELIEPTIRSDPNTRP